MYGDSRPVVEPPATSQVYRPNCELECNPERENSPFIIDQDALSVGLDLRKTNVDK
jgi:hypothetical protein